MEEACNICYRIRCRKCEWIASDEEARLIMREIMTKCPVCSWSPKEDILASR